LETIRSRTFLVSLLAFFFILAGVYLFWRIFAKEPANNPKVERQPAEQTFLRCSFVNKESYTGVFSPLPKITAIPKINAAIVSHHYLAKELIARLYNKIAGNDVSTIFLVSPDHFNNFYGSGMIAYTSYLPWQTPFGNLYADEKIIDHLGKNDGVSDDSPIVGLEHGISIEIPFIKYFFPQSKIVPIVLKNSSDYGDFAVLGQKLKEISGDRSILIVSTDFSHDLPAKEAKIKDEESIGILKNSGLDGLNGVNNDCRSCLAVLAGFLGNGGYDFSVVENKNSFDFSGKNEESVTSYLSGYYSGR
jgi:AmmeMemoRadiSam system protein B